MSPGPAGWVGSTGSTMPKTPETTGTSPTRYRPLLETGRWFASLPRDFQDALVGAARVRPAAAGERLFSRGDAPCGLYAVVEGAVRVSGVVESGKEAVLAHLEPPTWFGEISVFDGRPRTHDAAAESAAVLLQVPPAPLEALLDADPHRWRALGLLMAHQLRLAFVALEDLALQPPAQRLARRLAMIARGYGERGQGSRRVVEVRQEQLAMMLSLSRQTTNQLLKDLEARGVVRLKYGEIEIVDLEALGGEASEEGQA